MNQLTQRQAHRFEALEGPNRFAKARDFLRSAAFATLLSIGLPLPAQQTPPAVMGGTGLRVKFETKVSTSSSRVGDGVEARLIEPVEAEGREVLPVGTILTGRVISVRKGDTHRKVFPVLRLAFEQVRLPDGRTFPVKASVADLGMMVNVDSEGAATPAGHTKSDNVAAAAGTAGVGAGVGAIAGGGSGAAKGAAIGAGVGVIGDLLTRNDAYWDFTLNRGRKAWLRLDADLVVLTSPVAEPSPPKGLVSGTALSSPPEAAAPPAPHVIKGTIYLEPIPKARFYRVNEDALRRDISKAGILLVEEPSQAGLFLRVWNNSHGFHGELADRERVITWVDSATTQAGLLRSLVRYARGHGWVD